MKRSVLDSSAVITFLKDRSGAETIEQMLNQAQAGERELYLSVVSWGEILYTVWKAAGAKSAQQVEIEVGQFPIRVVHADMKLTRFAAEFKANYKLPYADCFVASLAKFTNADIVTADQDFAIISKQLKITFI